MRLLIDDTLATSTLTVPLESGWVTPPETLDYGVVPGLTAAGVGQDDAALLPSGELLALQQSHGILPDVAVVADAVGTVAMRTPVRPDEVAATPVRLLATSATAELLARATLQPFYGIEPTAWLRQDDAPDIARAEVVIVEGAEALREPEGGFSEDLARAWFILTAQPLISHVLLAPRAALAASCQAILTFLDAARAEGLARRREWRPALADREGLDRDRASAFWAAQRLTLAAADRQALLELLKRGTGGTSRTPPENVSFIEAGGRT